MLSGRQEGVSGISPSLFSCCLCFPGHAHLTFLFSLLTTLRWAKGNQPPFPAPQRRFLLLRPLGAFPSISPEELLGVPRGWVGREALFCLS